MTDGLVGLSISLAERVSIAFYQNAIPIASEIALTNQSAEDLAEVEIRLSSEPSYFVPALWRIERIVAGGVHHIALPDLRLEPGVLASLTETVRGQGSPSERSTATSSLRHSKAKSSFFLQATGAVSWRRRSCWRPLFVPTTRPSICSFAMRLRRLQARARQQRSTATSPSSKSGPTRSPRRSGSLLPRTEHHLCVASGKLRTQRAEGSRSPSDVMDRRVATCLDLSLLYAACAEQAGLNPAPGPGRRARFRRLVAEGRGFLRRSRRRRSGPAQAAQPG